MIEINGRKFIRINKRLTAFAGETAPWVKRNVSGGYEPVRIELLGELP